MRKIKINKTVTVDVDIDEEISISNSDILLALKNNSEIEAILEEYGYIKPAKIGLGTTLNDYLKINLLKQIVLKANINQLEDFLQKL